MAAMEKNDNTIGIGAINMSNVPDPRALLENSTVVFSREEVSAAVQKIADEINGFYGD